MRPFNSYVCDDSNRTFYSNGQAAVNLYVPVASVYSVFVGAYIIHKPAGVDIRQLVVVPTGAYPVGHDVLAIVIYFSTIVV